MNVSSASFATPAGPAGRILWRVSRLCAIAGGLLLAASAILTTLSIIYAAAFTSRIHGEYELVSFGTSLAIYLFLPWCQVVRGNVVVDFFLSAAGSRLREACDALGALLYFAVSVLLVWRMSAGGLELFSQGQATAVLKIPYWWSFPVILFCLGLLAAVTLHGVIANVRRALA
jgi:TRAP-type C4-dicarboxylate transport system permease small subunit